jgi:hypothetical protein
MKTPKPETWKDYKRERDHEMERRKQNPGVTYIVAGLIKPPRSLAELRDHFFNLRYAGIPRSRIEEALRVAYAEEQEKSA